MKEKLPRFPCRSPVPAPVGVPAPSPVSARAPVPAPPVPTSPVASRAGPSPESENGGPDALTLLRSETALSRFPLHRLTKGKTIGIEVHNPAAAVLWRVDHNSRYGPPGALAYKLDSLLINRRIEAARRPVPKVIRLGSLREIAEEVGSGNNTGTVKRALLQNATASITAKISYRTRSEGERRLEAVFHRYSLIFTGETLPHGEAADAVYLVLNDLYQDILNTAVFRPLDYDYMKSLPPIAQRFYEIVSYQMYAAVRHRNPCARLLYSQYCALSTATRYPDFDHVKKQMYKVLRPHIQSGYIAKVEYERVPSAAESSGAAGLVPVPAATSSSATSSGASPERDWWMCYTPGPGAIREYQSVNGRSSVNARTSVNGRSSVHARAGHGKGTTCSRPTQTEADSGRRRKRGQIAKENQSPRESPHPTPPLTDTVALIDTVAPTEAASDEGSELVEALVAADLNRDCAQRLAHVVPQVCRRQLAFLPFVKRFTSGRGAYLRRAIEGDFGPPKGYLPAQKGHKHSSPERAGDKSAPTLSQKARECHEERWREAFAVFVVEWLAELQNAHPEAFAAFTRWEAQRRQLLTSGPLAQGHLARRALASFDQPLLRADRILEFCREQGMAYRLTPPSFWEWDDAFNPESLRPRPGSVIP